MNAYHFYTVAKSKIILSQTIISQGPSVEMYIYIYTHKHTHIYKWEVRRLIVPILGLATMSLIK